MADIVDLEPTVVPEPDIVLVLLAVLVLGHDLSMVVVLEIAAVAAVKYRSSHSVFIVSNFNRFVDFTIQ